MAIGETFEYAELDFRTFTGTEGIDRKVIFRGLEFDDTHEPSQVESIVKGSESNGWSLYGLTIHTESDYVITGIRDAETAFAVFDALFESPENAGQIIAYGELFGWLASNFERNRWGRKYEEGYHGVYDDEEDFAREFVENDASEIPWYVSIDWEDTTATIMNDHASYEYGSEVYIFANH